MKPRVEDRKRTVWSVDKNQKVQPCFFVRPGVSRTYRVDIWIAKVHGTFKRKFMDRTSGGSPPDFWPCPGFLDSRNTVSGPGFHLNVLIKVVQ